MNSEFKIFAGAYDVRELQRLSKLEASIAAQIEKAIARYFAVREYRRATLPKLIGNSSSAALPSAQFRRQGDVHGRATESVPAQKTRNDEENDSGNQDDDEEFDWEHEYDEYKRSKDKD